MWAQRARDNRGHKGAGRQDPAHLDAVPDREPGPPRREAHRARSDLGEKKAFFTVSGSEANEAALLLRHALPELERGHSPEVFLPRPLVRDDGHNGPEHPEPDLPLRAGRGVRAEPLPLALRVLQARGQVQPALRTTCARSSRRRPRATSRLSSPSPYRGWAGSSRRRRATSSGQRRSLDERGVP